MYKVVLTGLAATIGIAFGWGARAQAEQLNEENERHKQNIRADQATSLRRRVIELQAEQKNQEAGLREANEALKAANEMCIALRESFEKKERALITQLQESTERAAKLQEEVRLAKEYIADMEAKAAKAAAAATSRRSILGGFMH